MSKFHFRSNCGRMGPKGLLRAREEDMQDTALPKPIPAELPGAVCQQWVKCGKPNCHCARGELHGPY